MKQEVTSVKKCRLCKSLQLVRFLDLGKMPIPNGFLKPSDLNKKEPEYELACFYCRNCSLVQLTKIVDPQTMFGHYVYMPSASKTMLNNFANLAYTAKKDLKLNSKSMVIDLGSNDGSLLKFFKNHNINVLGIDPAKNIAELAAKDGIPTKVGLFTPQLARQAVKKYGLADLITATNVIAHIDNLDEVFEGIKILLKEDGSVITEFPYLLDLISKNQFDTIYHEHLSYFNLKSWNRFIESHGFKIKTITRRPVHGGSIRITHSRVNSGSPKSGSVAFLTGLESENKLDKEQTYFDFSQSVLRLKKDLKNLLTKLKKQKKRIVGLGAPAKGNVLTCFFDIGPETLDYIVDSTPLKHGLFTPKKHIPIYPESKLLEDPPDYALILAWNFKEEIIRKHKLFQNKGGKFIIPIPDIKIV